MEDSQSMMLTAYNTKMHTGPSRVTAESQSSKLSLFQCNVCCLSQISDQERVAWKEMVGGGEGFWAKYSEISIPKNLPTLPALRTV